MEYYITSRHFRKLLLKTLSQINHRNNKEISLEYGEYYLTLSKVPNGYKLNKDRVRFSVNDNSCVGTIKLINKKVNMPITSTKSSIIGIILLIIDLGIYYFVKKAN